MRVLWSSGLIAISRASTLGVRSERQQEKATIESRLSGQGLAILSERESCTALETLIVLT